MAETHIFQGMAKSQSFQAQAMSDRITKLVRSQQLLFLGFIFIEFFLTIGCENNDDGRR